MVNFTTRCALVLLLASIALSCYPSSFAQAAPKCKDKGKKLKFLDADGKKVKRKICEWVAEDPETRCHEATKKVVTKRKHGKRKTITKNIKHKKHCCMTCLNIDETDDASDDDGCPIVEPDGQTTCKDYSGPSECEFNYIYTADDCTWDTLKCSPTDRYECQDGERPSWQHIPLSYNPCNDEPPRDEPDPRPTEWLGKSCNPINGIPKQTQIIERECPSREPKESELCTDMGYEKGRECPYDHWYTADDCTMETLKCSPKKIFKCSEDDTPTWLMIETVPNACTAVFRPELDKYLWKSCNPEDPIPKVCPDTIQAGGGRKSCTEAGYEQGRKCSYDYKYTSEDCSWRGLQCKATDIFQCDLDGNDTWIHMVDDFNMIPCDVPNPKPENWVGDILNEPCDPNADLPTEDDGILGIRRGLRSRIII